MNIYPGLGVCQEEWLFVGPGEGSNQSEVLSLPLASGTCGLTIDPLPQLLDREGAAAALLEGLVTVCNCAAEDEKTHCFSLDPVLGTWVESMNQEKKYNRIDIVVKL